MRTAIYVRVILIKVYRKAIILFSTLFVWFTHLKLRSIELGCSLVSFRLLTGFCDRWIRTACKLLLFCVNFGFFAGYYWTLDLNLLLLHSLACTHTNSSAVVVVIVVWLMVFLFFANLYNLNMYSARPMYILL